MPNVDNIRASAEATISDITHNGLTGAEWGVERDTVRAMVESAIEDIEHHGVKGMKWGVRRSQAQLDRAAGRKVARTKAQKRRADSRTKKRKERQASRSAARDSRKEDTQRRAAFGAAKREEREVAKNPGKQKFINSETGRITTRGELGKNRRSLSDNDLTDLIKRLESEKKLKGLIEQDVAPGRTFAKTVMGDAGKRALTTVATGAMLYGAKYTFDRKFDAKEFGKVISRGGFDKKK